MSKVRKDLEEEGFDEDDVQTGVIAHSGHASKSAAMYYQRQSTQVVRPLDTVWKNTTRDASDHLDMVRTMAQKTTTSVPSTARLDDRSRSKGRRAARRK